MDYAVDGGTLDLNDFPLTMSALNGDKGVREPRHRSAGYQQHRRK
jgi:hypothetical protein